MECVIVVKGEVITDCEALVMGFVLWSIHEQRQR